MKLGSLFLLLVLLQACGCFAPANAEEKKRRGKFFNVFQVITFPNGPCIGSGNQNGTCYTEDECNSRGGANGGTCASGFGVCCIISVTCGQESSENCTYFESSGVTSGCCEAQICPCGDNICQLRLDFDTFTITGPTTNTVTVAVRRIAGGDVTVDANTEGVGVSAFGQCLTDRFSVSNPDGPGPPSICGVNKGEHMYVESSKCCNKLTFSFGNTGVGTTIATRSWSIKVTQYSCNYPNLAPQGCTQYYFDSTTNNVQSFNYNNGNGVHLADQDQAICVRRERSNCRICWTVVADGDFATRGVSDTATRNYNLCCDYGAISTDTKKGFDCVQIPNAVTPDSTPTPRQSVFCGNNKGLKGGTSCSTRTPFQLNFRSDHWEGDIEASAGGVARNRGFMLVYIMDAIGCNPAGIVTA